MIVCCSLGKPELTKKLIGLLNLVIFSKTSWNLEMEKSYLVSILFIVKFKRGSLSNRNFCVNLIIPTQSKLNLLFYP